MATPDPAPQADKRKPIVLMSPQTRNTLVVTAIVVILLTVMAWSGARRTEAAKRGGLASDTAALAASLKYAMLEARSMRTDAGRERLRPLAVEIGAAGSYVSVTIADPKGQVLATTKGALEAKTPLEDLPTGRAQIGRNSRGLTASAPIRLGDSVLGYLFVETDR